MNGDRLMQNKGRQRTGAAIGYVLFLGTVVVLMASSTCLAAQDDGAITEKIIEAYGGRERLAKVSAVSAEGRIKALMRGDEGVYRRSMQRDGKLYVDIQYRRSKETRILNGARGFRGAGGTLEEVSGPRLQAMIYQYNELNLPFGLLDNALTLAELRADEVNGKKVRVFRCSDRSGNTIEVYVDAKDFRIVKTRGTFFMGAQSTSLDAEFSDFRDVGGIQFPFRIDNYAGGSKISETVMSQYLINPTLNNALFNP